MLPPPARRACAARASVGRLDAHQDALQAALERSGDGWLTTTRLRGATWLRAGIVNYLSTEDDIDRLLDTLRDAGRRARLTAGARVSRGVADRRGNLGGEPTDPRRPFAPEGRQQDVRRARASVGDRRAWSPRGAARHRAG